MSVDNTKPFYNVCGGTQDNWSFCGPSRSMTPWGVRTSDWYVVNGGDGFQTRNDPENPDIIYAQSQDGGIRRYNRRTARRAASVRRSRRAAAAAAAAPVAAGRRAARKPAAARRPADRSNWDTPYIISPHSATRLYWATQYVYRSDDRGDTLDAHQPRPLAQPRSVDDPDHGQGRGRATRWR